MNYSFDEITLVKTSAARQAMETGELATFLSRAKSVCVLTGAGISQESGVPTFRGPGGLWKQYRPEELATPEAFARDPMTVWEWYAWRREIIGRAQPNAAHFALAEMEQLFAGDTTGQFSLLTQNVDGLHNRAGSRNVIRLHGDIWRLRCTQCGSRAARQLGPPGPLSPAVRMLCTDEARRGLVWRGPAGSYLETGDDCRRFIRFIPHRGNLGAGGTGRFPALAGKAKWRPAG